MIVQGNVCVNNIGFIYAAAQILVDGNSMTDMDNAGLFYGTFAISNGDGTVTTPDQMYYCYGKPGIYVFAEENVSHGGMWKITGTSNLIGSTIHVSTRYREKNFNSIIENALKYTAVVNDNGNFEFEIIKLSAGPICCWIEINSMEANNVGQSTLTFSLEEIASDEKAYLRYKIFNTWNKNTCPACFGAGSFDMDTQCPVCEGDGNETFETGNATCRYCKGSTILLAGECPGCQGTGSRSEYFIKPKCTISGEWPGAAIIDRLRISPYDESIFSSPSINTSTNIEKLNNTAFKTISIGDTGVEAFSYNVYFDSDNHAGLKQDNAKYVLWGLSDSLSGKLTVNAQMSEGYKICLSGDTLITMADGSQQRLDELKESSVVASPYGPTNVLQLSQGKYSSAKHTKYYFENNIIIDETNDHRFFNIDQGIFQIMKKWNIGDRALDINNNEVKLLSKEVIHEDILCYGIWTDNGTYYANNLLSGCTASNKHLFENMTADQMITMMQSIDTTQLNTVLGFQGGILP